MAIEYNIGNVIGPPGKSPYINTNGNWDEWDGAQWVDTGVKAQGPTGPIGDITGQSLFDNSVANGFTGTYDDWLREYLGSVSSSPWVTGYFNNRSIAANTWTTLTPIVTGGDASMVSGDDFACPEDGVYLFVFSGAYLISATNSEVTFRVSNLQGESTFDMAINATTSSKQFPCTVMATRWEEGVTAHLELISSVAQSSIQNLTIRNSFYVGKLR